MIPNLKFQSSMELEKCFFCDNVAQNVCSNCQLVSYCCQDHLKIHRPEKICFPFTVQSSPSVGRYMVATRDIKASGKLNIRVTFNIKDQEFH